MIGVVEILLCDPEFPHNVGGAVRAASCFGAKAVTFTGSRVPDPHSHAMSRFERRLPREERMRAFRDVDVSRVGQGASPYSVIQLIRRVREVGMTPVCVEFDDTAELLPYFVHPENALYVFGPEDGSVSASTRSACHRFVTIPTRSCVNLAAAVYITLYDRTVKCGWEPRRRETG